MVRAPRRATPSGHGRRVRGRVQRDQALSDAIGLVEFKTHGVDVRPAWDYYEAQVQWQLYVTGFDLAVLAVATVDDSRRTASSGSGSPSSRPTR